MFINNNQLLDYIYINYEFLILRWNSDNNDSHSSNTKYLGFMLFEDTHQTLLEYIDDLIINIDDLFDQNDNDPVLLQTA